MEKLKRVGLWLWDGLGNFIMIGGWLGSAALVAWATQAAGIMAAYAPFSWVAAGVIGAILVASAYTLLQVGRRIGQNIRERRDFLKDADAIDPMESIFKNKRIKIIDLVNPYNQVVKDKKFIDCELIGPANLYIIFRNAKFQSNNFDQADSIEIRDNAVPQNAIAFANCDFEGCRFFKVSMLFQSSSRSVADQIIANMNWLTEIEEPTFDLEDSTSGKTGIRGFIRRLTSGDAGGTAP